MMSVGDEHMQFSIALQDLHVSQLKPACPGVGGIRWMKANAAR
jgi:hypothetical protein